MRGYVQVYTGNGKGKTTAALGLALRAVGAGLKVFIGQFIKLGDYSEIKALDRFSDQIQWSNSVWDVSWRAPFSEEYRCGAKGLARIREVMAAADYQ